MHVSDLYLSLSIFECLSDLPWIEVHLCIGFVNGFCQNLY